MPPVITAQDVPSHGHLEVATGTIVTPAARDLAKERGVAIVEMPASQLRPAVDPSRTIAIGADHGGFRMKEALKPILSELGYLIHDVGVAGEQPVDYPDLAEMVANAVATRTAAYGVMIDGAGIGSAMAANKVPGIRAALCYDRASARNSKEHNAANVLTLGGKMLTHTQAEDVLRTWLATPYAAGRHQARIDKITALEKKHAK
jgi:ribose 5-phosphate isomerase B